MADITELLPCPFCGGQAKVSSFPGAHNVWCENQPVNCGNRAMFTVEQWNRRAAPPEDVRAVVDEPVAYAVFTDKGHIRIWSSDCDAVGLKVEAEEGRKAVPLYLHPQLPMVLPERQDPGPALHQWPQGWNACLDEISRLNK